MGNATKEFYEKFAKDSAKMGELLPDAMNGFKGMFGSIMKEGALAVKEKELIALSIAVATNCTPCIRLHTKKCLDAGATKEQILEAAAVAMMMAGGPAFTHVPIVIDALEALEA